MNEDKKKCLESGMNYFLSKPIDPEKLLLTINMFNKTEKTANNSDITFKKTQENYYKLVNYDLLLERLAGCKTTLKKIVQYFIDNYHVEMLAIKQAIDEADDEKLYKSAHKFKGSIGNFSTAKPYKVAYELEQIGRSGNINNAINVYSKLEKEIELLIEELLLIIR